MNLRTYAGLGDVLAALPIAYAVAEHGEPVGLAQFNPPRANLTRPELADLCALPLLSGDAGTQSFDLTQAWDWRSAASLLDRSLARMGLEWGTTPRTALLDPEPGNPLGLHSRGYVVVCNSAHYADAEKRVTDAHLAAIREVCTRHSLETVLVGDTAGDRCPVDRDMRGQTTIGELVRVVNDALCVVSVDTGVLHLAGSLSVPTLALCGVGYTPVAALQDYYPLLTLQAAQAGKISPLSVRDALGRVVAAARVSWAVCGPSRRPDGPAECGRVAAQAAGVPYRSFAEAREAGGWHVAEAIETDAAELAGLDLSRTVLSLHVGCAGLLPQAAAVLFRGRSVMAANRHLARRGWYVPLAAPWQATCDPEPGLVGWHGILHPRKRLKDLLAAAPLAGKRVLVCGSEAPGHTPDGYADTIRAAAGPGVEVDVRPWWEAGDLQAALSRCEVLCYPDTMPKEQSAASTDALGLGRPVVVGVGTAHDDVRGWCTTAAPEGLAEALCRVTTEDGARAAKGACYRTPALVARQYRAAVQQAALDALR